MCMANYYERIKTLRQMLKINQTDLANYLNVNQRTISNWENNISQPSYELIQKLCDFFRISTDYIFYNDRKTIDLIYKKREEVIPRILTTNKNDEFAKNIKSLIIKFKNITNNKRRLELSSQDLLTIQNINFEINNLIIQEFKQDFLAILPNRDRYIEGYYNQKDKLIHCLDEEK